MRYYVIINGINSLTIPGLAIKSLPPISKTLMRNQKETIDGRNGDIITELGYSAYDKTLTIGLFGTYDINQIIAFFNQKGTIVFSDEPDKYYKFSILEQIDFAKLVKFRTANVRIHCQPFKYEVNETPIVVEAEFVEGTGTDLTLNNTTEAPLDIKLLPDTQQETTTGKNLFNPTYMVETQYLTNGNVALDNDRGYSISNNIITSKTSTYTARRFLNKMSLKAGTYTISGKVKFKEATSYYMNNSVRDLDNLVDIKGLTGINIGTSEGNFSFSFTLNQDYSGISISLQPRQPQDGTLELSEIQLESGSTATSYEPYTGGIPAPNPEFPMPIQVVTGNQNIKVENKNIANLQDMQLGKALIGAGVGTDYYYENNAKRSVIMIKVKPSTQYAVSIASGFYLRRFSEFASSDLTNCLYDRAFYSTGFVTQSTITTKSSTNYLVIVIQPNPDGNMTQEMINNCQLMVELNSTVTDYISHQEQNYPLTLGNLEYCKIGNYSDRIFKNIVGDTDYDSSRELGKWYIKKNIGRIDLSTITFNKNSHSVTGYSRYSTNAIPNIKYVSSNTQLGNGLATKYINHTGSGMSGSGSENCFAIDTSLFQVSTLSTENPSGLLYYEVATPTYELLSNTLQEQLNALENAMSYNNQTNISSSGDLPIIMDVSAYKDGTNKATINNTGNIYAKPTIDLEGSGTIGVYFGNTQLLSINMISDVTIDSENMEAYDPDTLQSRNRQVTGSYENIKFEPGNTNIKFSGKITKATIRNWKRWL